MIQFLAHLLFGREKTDVETERNWVLSVLLSGSLSACFFITHFGQSFHLSVWQSESESVSALVSRSVGRSVRDSVSVSVIPSANRDQSVSQ